MSWKFSSFEEEQSHLRDAFIYASQSTGNFAKGGKIKPDTMWTGFDDLKSVQYSKWLKSNEVTDIEFEMISYNTLILKPTKQEIIKFCYLSQGTD